VSCGWVEGENRILVDERDERDERASMLSFQPIPSIGQHVRVGRNRGSQLRMIL
jgi:hypothetical protein